MINKTPLKYIQNLKIKLKEGKTRLIRWYEI